MRDDDIIGELDSAGYPWTMKCGRMVRSKYRVIIYFKLHGRKEYISEVGASIYEAVAEALNEFHRSRDLYGFHMKPDDSIKFKEPVPDGGAISLKDVIW
jgi:hypothetical protein